MPYCTATDIDTRFGKSNVEVWADLNNNRAAPEIAAAVTAAIDAAETMINDRLRGGPYTVPFADTDVNATIRDVCATLAGVWLYENRAQQNINPQTGRGEHGLSMQKARAEKQLTMILDGRITLDVADRTTMHPIVVQDTET